MRAPVIMGAMGRSGFLVLLVVVGCAHKKQLNLLEKEKLQFRAENEKLRAEDLEDRYREQKKKADALSSELLALERDRDRLYTQYDLARGETVRLERELKVSGERQGAMAQALAQGKAEEARLQAELEAERKAIQELEAQIAAARAKHAELAGNGTPASE
jgi:predicted RNase H-like nuclease (RuvC/YqgF family)